MVIGYRQASSFRYGRETTPKEKNREKIFFGDLT